MCDQAKAIENKNIENNKIIVVGNGFDISVGIKSSYEQFIDYIKDRHHFIEDLELYEYNRLFLRKYQDFKLNWSDFESLYEETVRNVNKRVLQHEELQDSLEINTINAAIKKLEKDFYDYISDEYHRWLQQNTVDNSVQFKKFSKKINPVIKQLLSDEHAFFINFNYTETLEDIVEDILFEKVQKDSNIIDNLKSQIAYKRIREAKNRIAHIHGSIEEENILFGGGFADREDTVDIHYSKSLLNDKLFRIKENDKLNTTRKIIMDELNKFDGTNEKIKEFDLYIMGHSLQGSDFPFLSRILNNAKRVFIFYYENDYVAKLEELIKRLGSSIIEKVVLVPFVEVMYEKKDLLIYDYKEYEAIAPFLQNKFPNESILASLSLTTWHFIFRHISELVITPENIEIVLELVNKLHENNVSISILRIFFSDKIEEDVFEKIRDSKSFMKILETVERVSFEKTGVEIKFLETLLEKANRLSYLRLNHCVLLGDSDQKIDVSICESLSRLELKECVYNIQGVEKPVVFNSDKSEHSIEKLVIDTNTNIIFENSLFENSRKMLELSIRFSDSDINSVEGHLENLEILYIDCSATIFPNLTVGNSIKEVTIVGYPEDKFVLSTLLKNTGESFGFPNFRILQLNSADNITNFEQIDIDVVLDVFSKNINIILDDQRISIDQYYKIRPFQLNKTSDKFLIKGIDILKKTISRIVQQEVNDSMDVYEEFKMWYQEISEYTGELEEDSAFLGILEQKLIGSQHRIKEIGTKQIEKSEEVDSSGFNKHSQNVEISKVNNVIMDYSSQKINKETVLDFLRQTGRKEFIVDIYKKVLNDISEPINNETLILLKQKYFVEEKTAIINNFSKKWFVSEKELKFSSMQYEEGMEYIPNIKGIIESRDFDDYKKMNPESKKFKYPQEMKRNWKVLLENELIFLEKELRDSN